MSVLHRYIQWFSIQENISTMPLRVEQIDPRCVNGLDNLMIETKWIEMEFDEVALVGNWYMVFDKVYIGVWLEP